MKKQFTVINDNFICENCNKEVLATKKGSPRSHCPFCLYSKHVDVNPGDRACTCLGLMKPVGIEISAKKGYVITHECMKCFQQKKNKAATDDNFELILKISQGK